ncbi:MAG: hypothetical protein ACI8XO_004851, partial [Verrucomicrobiales bacterium]
VVDSFDNKAYLSKSGAANSRAAFFVCASNRYLKQGDAPLL